MSPLQSVADDMLENGDQPPTSSKGSVTADSPPPLYPIGKSQHTIVEYYSDNEEEEEDFEEVESEDENFDDNSTNNEDDVARQEAEQRCDVLQRAASRQSMLSAQSDAFSLPLGSQDDVSSLGCDNVDEMDGGSSAQVDDISLKELKRSFMKTTGGVSGSTGTRATSVKDTMCTDEFPSNPLMEKQLANDGRIKNLREIFVNSRKNQISALNMSTSSNIIKMDHLTEGENETDGDDDDEIDTKSLNFADLQELTELEAEREEGSDKDYDDLIARMHMSFFLPRGLAKSASSMEGSITSRTPKARNRKRASGNLPLQETNEQFYDSWTKNLPPELDLKEARKYLIQLAEGVPNTPATPAKLSAPTNYGPASNTKSTAIKSMDSEYTEIVIDDDSGLQTPRNTSSFISPIVKGRRLTPTRTTLAANFNRTPSVDSLSTEYTEVVIEETPTSSARGNKKLFGRSGTDTSYDITEIVEYDETVVEEEEIIEEEVLDETEVEEELGEALDVCNQ